MSRRAYEAVKEGGGYFVGGFVAAVSAGILALTSFPENLVTLVQLLLVAVALLLSLAGAWMLLKGWFFWMRGQRSS